MPTRKNGADACGVVDWSACYSNPEAAAEAALFARWGATARAPTNLWQTSIELNNLYRYLVACVHMRSAHFMVNQEKGKVVMF
jgi:hypothetical protein